MEKSGAAAAAAVAKEHLGLEMAAPADSATQRLPFFGRRRSENTWVVSLFVVVHLVAFFVTMFVNDCPGRSGGDCALRPLGRFSFQPFFENPLLGPSSSTLVKVGALQRTFAIQRHEKWRLVTCPWLHAGVIHLILDLLSTIFLGVHLQQDFGPVRTGVIYLLSAFLGSVVSSIFVQHVPVAGSSAALFGFLGATLSGLIRNWQTYANKVTAIAVLLFVASMNFSVGLLPRVDNFGNIGGFLSGILLGFALLFNPQLSQLERKKGLFDYDLNRTVKLRQKLDKPALRIVALVFFFAILAGGLAAAFHGVNASEHCGWCHYINCVPTKMWSCNEQAVPCEEMVSNGRLTLTCMRGDKFRTYPFANISQERIGDLCSLICS
ncbi:RHOMBOID-like protein 8 [Phoenix dactylifera]|uniref:RHOMBOID-like protein n=1 Tax=Phoenix dactylifera TaxID=42345 RepID=A0A8B7BQX2_PHODC|nr:RHOMBOID-like protein 8 [Phoenix dactylifera]